MKNYSDPWIEVTPRLRIPLAELHFRFSRSPGPGGQNVNKVNTKATLFFDVAHSPSLSEPQRARCLSRLASRIDSDGVLRVVSSRHRTQAANRAAALHRLAELLTAAMVDPKTRVPTRATRASVGRRLNAKTRRSQAKRMRSYRSELE